MSVAAVAADVNAVVAVAADVNAVDAGVDVGVVIAAVATAADADVVSELFFLVLCPPAKLGRNDLASCPDAYPDGDLELD